jgi:uncharacterized protein
MQLFDNKLVFSASDFANFLECEHLTTLDLTAKLHPEIGLKRTADDDEALLVQAKGQEHESSYLKELRDKGLRIEDLSKLSGNLDDAVSATYDAMCRGVEIIYQAALRNGQFLGYADFLRRVRGASKLGEWHYEVVDTKLAKSPKAKFLIQLCFYADLLVDIQGVAPGMVHLVFGSGVERSFRTADYQHYFAAVKQRFLAHVEKSGEGTYPDPVDRCDLCHWSEICEQRRQNDDHLCQVANITRVQIRKLNDAGVSTLAALSALPEDMSIPGINLEPLARLRHQSLLQMKKKELGSNFVDLLPIEPHRGFNRLPLRDVGDMFFDMEGDPYEEDGLEYLFGVGYLENDEFHFKPFWAHNRLQERKAFEDFVDWVSERLSKFPNAHVYHYASYEETALKRLMSQHGTREQQIDNFLRQHKLVDLYKVVREGVRVSEPRYSIKNLECFYTKKRAGDVKTAGASIVWYERYKETGDVALLEDIRAYNEDDCRSTWQLLEWLLTLRPNILPWATSNQQPTAEQEGEDRPIDLLLEEYREALLGDAPEDTTLGNDTHRLRELTLQLMDFHRREDKPKFWAHFKRMEMDEEQLREDGECIAGLQRDPNRPPRADKRSLIHTYTYPEQEFKLKTGDPVTDAATGDSLNKVTIDEENRRIELRLGKNFVLPERLSIGTGRPIGSKILQEANRRFADSMLGRRESFQALEQLLMRQFPRIERKQQGTAIIDDGEDLLPQIIEAVAGLDMSYLYIQGPPGAGKTYSGSRIIVEMLRRGKRVAVASNSHHAINNLLAAVGQVADEQRFSFIGAKKSTRDQDGTTFNGKFLRNVYDKKEITSDDQLVAGTAWLFADVVFDQAFDLLFVDEAGQVALANLIAMGTCAKNIVLLGDPMQLGQPTQGTHPGRSGESCLEYLLDGRATVAPDMGVFLATTWRMAPKVCEFISDAVYDGRLIPEQDNARQHLFLGKSADPILCQSGIRFVECIHEGCGQKSQEEAERIRTIYDNLLSQSYVDRKGEMHPITACDILVVAPYNMQVNLLRKALPGGARVGTVDKFQGQEAPVVIVSMTTSSGDDLPRDISFLFSKNRLNVAISRAKCLAIVVASPKLLAIKCSTVEQMALVNLLCWVAERSSANEM